MKAAGPVGAGSAGRTQSARSGPRRRWWDAVLAAGGALLFVLAALPVDSTTVPAAEADVFEFVNDRTVLPFVVVWLLMQLGNVLIVPAAALLAALLGRFRLATGLLLAGLAAYVVAKVVKRLADRARPGELLTGVDLRGAASHGLGFVSGHAAVATALAAFAWPWLGRRARVAVAVVAGLVCLARVYVGAHLPLDVVGGLGVGLTAAGVARLVVGRPPAPAVGRAAPARAR